MTKYKPWWELGVQALTKLNVFPAGTAACCNQAIFVCAAEVWYICCQVQALAVASVAAQGEIAQQSSSPAASQALTVFRRPLLGASPRLSSAFELPVVGALGYSLSPVQVRRLPCWLFNHNMGGIPSACCCVACNLCRPICLYCQHFL